MRTPARAPLLTPPGVYAPHADTELLARALRSESVGAHTRVLDLCTGSGALALLAARRGARVTAVDISLRAVLTVRLNALLARRPMTVLRGDLVSAVPDRTFDLVVTNPPYVPAPAPAPPARGAARAWDAGPDGRVLLDRICDSVPPVLRGGGILLLVHSAICGTVPTLERLAAAGMDAEVTDRDAVPLGPVLRGRRDWLRSHGLLPDGDREELVVIRARHS
ncbi:HemK2/MTQ2 family protein methyltransferase [Streptomyces tropicalis]|uniref:Methyltransferase n=1 Tax=Streptomyces tropicalis TaxID=3034234 RepID=A0ABT6A2M8_9ACTN|nr:HemK2/MTQ2 family protein methyltransferase [Streptomyces tropicalis]MDF3298892.1 methyltransferase [Streptomyces tropicalis]